MKLSNDSKLAIRLVGALIFSAFVNLWLHLQGFNAFESLILSTLTFIAALLVILISLHK